MGNYYMSVITVQMYDESGNLYTFFYVPPNIFHICAK